MLADRLKELRAPTPTLWDECVCVCVGGLCAHVFCATTAEFTGWDRKMRGNTTDRINGRAFEPSLSQSAGGDK